MADDAHVLTDEKLEEMEKRLSAIYSRAEKTVQKKMARNTLVIKLLIPCFTILRISPHTLSKKK